VRISSLDLQLDHGRAVYRPLACYAAAPCGVSRLARLVVVCTMAKRQQSKNVNAVICRISEAIG
jgi:hypothetical protein